jgi:methylase of polypeptide subunit release factors
LVLADISDKALQVAKENAESLFENLKNIYFLQSDLLSDISDVFYNKPFVIVANLPYIPDDIFFENVEENVKKWEPSIAFL